MTYKKQQNNITPIKLHKTKNRTTEHKIDQKITKLHRSTRQNKTKQRKTYRHKITLHTTK